MSEQPLQGLRILVVEDEYLLADDMRDALVDAGAEVLGPAANIGAATSLAAAELHLDAALLDINLGGTLVFEFADTLRARSVPFAFATGYDSSVVPDRFADVPRMEKPVTTRNVILALQPLVHSKSA